MSNKAPKMYCASLRRLSAPTRRWFSSFPAPPPFQPRRRVVVTGIGMVTPFGVGTARTWDRLLAGATATVALQGPQYADLPCRVAGLVPRGTDPGHFDEASLPHAPSSRTAPFVQFALAAADEALADAGFGLERSRLADAYFPNRVAVCVGSGMGSLDDILAAGRQVDAGQSRRVSPFFVPKVLPRPPTSVERKTACLESSQVSAL